MDQTKVLIVGAGPTGLVLALWLTKAGIPIRIIDKTDKPGTTSRATIIHARNLEFYHQLGIDQTAIAGGLQLKTINLWIRGKKAAQLPIGDFGIGYSPYPYVLVFPQDKQEQMLSEELKKLGIEIERNTELLSFDFLDDVIQARLLKDGRQEECMTLFLAGCDGAHSSVRKELHEGFEGGSYAHTFFVADIKASGPAANGEMHAAMDSSDFVMIFPMTGDSNVRLVGDLHHDQENNPDLTWEDVRKDILSRMKLDVETVNWFSSYQVHHRVANRFRQKNVFLLGDAAHIHSPVGGQGMNTGIGDAVNLAWKLAAVINGQASEKLLDSFEAERIPFARKLVSSTDRAFSFVSSRSAFATWVRIHFVPVVLPILFRSVSFKRFLFRTVSQISIRYPQSFLSSGKAGKLSGGDRLPWVQQINNFEPLISKQWQAHFFGIPKAGLNNLFTKKNIPLYIFEWGPETKKAGYLKDALYIVRPDGYIGLVDRTVDISKISKYCDTYILHDKLNQMEVHHHPDLDHKKKKFREYFLEFLMIFLAVTLGFIAENVRESISDRRKEKDYIESMIQDLKTDTAKSGETIEEVNKQMRGMDTLEMFLTPDVNKNDSSTYICYRQNKALFNENTMNFSDRTITQLFSSGNMRLFKKQSISDSITDYYSTIRNTEAQKQYYKEYFQKCLAIAQEIYEFEAFHTRIDSRGNAIFPALGYGKFHIANTNAADLQRFKSTIDLTKRIIASYRDHIKFLNRQGRSLLRFLKEEYGIEDAKIPSVAR
jgi:2-polyprenyl-6-methoxyphenol hydroxylase-like FAD-dependent oxidoreductase